MGYFTSQHESAGTVLFSQGDPADHLFIILTGEISVKYKPYDAPEIVVTRLREGGVLGWSAVLGNSAYTSSAVCVSNVDFLQVTQTELRKLINEHPQTGRILMDRLAVAVAPRWKDARTQVRKMLEKGMELPVQDDGGDKMDETMTHDPAQELRLKALLEQLSAYIETYHGGSVEYIGLEKDTLKVHLGGACLGCPLSPATLHGWVEGTVKQFFPEIAHVEAV
jgi:CRP-like cAMP-binding protein